MRRNKEENLHKLAGQTKIVIMVEAEVVFKEEVVDEVEEMLLEVMVDTSIKEVLVEK